MASVHGIDCTFVKGQPKELTQRVDTFQVPGIDGYGAQVLGKGNAEFRFAAILLDTKTNVDTWIAAILAKVGEIGIVIDDWGVSHENLLIVDAMQPSKTVAVFTGIEARASIVLRGVKQS